MGFNWTEEADKEGGSRAPRIPVGQHDLTIAKVVFGTKTKGWFKSSNGDRQIMLIVTDEKGGEASIMVTLSDKAAFVLAQILKAAGADTNKMNERGITPEKFTDEKFATAALVGRKFRGEVEYEKGQGDDKKEYARITPLRPSAKSPPGELVGAGAGKTADPIDEIPF